MLQRPASRSQRLALPVLHPPGVSGDISTPVLLRSPSYDDKDAKIDQLEHQTKIDRRETQDRIRDMFTQLSEMDSRTRRMEHVCKKLVTEHGHMQHLQARLDTMEQRLKQRDDELRDDDGKRMAIVSQRFSSVGL